MYGLASAWMDQPASSSTENLEVGQRATGTSESRSKRKKPQQQPRQLLSCTKCRERKVKCDRTKPCSACCARGQPKECHFIVVEGGDYGPIQQSYELRKLRAENLRLKERLRAVRSTFSEGDQHGPPLQEQQNGSRGTSKSSTRSNNPKPKRLRSQDHSDNLYFGSPGISNLINDFTTLHFTPKSLSHTMPRRIDMYANRNASAYPFATMWPTYPQACIPALVACLPARLELYTHLNAFQRRAQSCSFPHIPQEITKKEIDRFLSDTQKNSEMFPDMLALIFATLALGTQCGIFDKNCGKWVEGAMQAESPKGDVYMAAAMQALRMASYLNRPTLLGIQTLIMIGPYLTNSGRFLDAWSLFGVTIRLAHSIGLHRNPKFLNPVPPLRDCAIRQTIWWWMLHMDQQYSMTLGRPLGISGIGDCPPPEPLTTNPTILRFGEYINQFTILARQILSSDPLTNAKIDDFTDRLKSLLDTIPELLQFNMGWLDEATEIPEWPVNFLATAYYAKTHNYLILLNRQRIEPASHSQLIRTRGYPIQICNPSTISSMSLTLPRGRQLVIRSSLAILQTLFFCHRRIPAALICWSILQQAFNASMILLVNAVETGDLGNIATVEQSLAIFSELEEKGVHKLAALAVERLNFCLNILRQQEKSREKIVNGTFGGDEESKAAVEGDLEGVLDTVMGNTGMLLLEDSGLQSTNPSAFVPLTWDMVGSDLTCYRQTTPSARLSVSPSSCSPCSSSSSASPSGLESSQQTITPLSAPAMVSQASNSARFIPTRSSSYPSINLPPEQMHSRHSGGAVTNPSNSFSMDEPSHQHDLSLRTHSQLQPIQVVEQLSFISQHMPTPRQPHNMDHRSQHGIHAFSTQWAGPVYQTSYGREP